MSIQLTTDQINANIEALQGIKKAKINIAAMIKHDYYLFLQGNALAGAAIVQYWQSAEAHNVLPLVRAQLSTASKEVHKETGVNEGRGAKVENGAIVLAASRNKAKNALLEKAKEISAGDLTSEQLAQLAQILDAAVQSL